ncbi:MAG: copper homeostasis protein CutC [Pasteurellaceae bacterium]|nr:copper homeostasis protein CutC [Pasteurellaceae bacterium]
MYQTPKIEICVDNIESVITANRLPIDRIELCSALALGGLSPNFGLLQQAVEISTIPLAVMIRPRAGDFVFSPHEVNAMFDEIALCKALGVQHIVIGALTAQGEMDLETTKRLIDAADGMEITFHRAFDLCVDPFKALDQLIDLECQRILTSGQAQTAFEGIPLLRELVEKSAGCIQIMAGCGVNAENVHAILRETQVPQLHFSAKGQRPSPYQATSSAVMGSSAEQDKWLEVLDYAKAGQILARIGKGLD